MQDQRPEVKMYSDYKSPYAYLAFDPGFGLEQKYEVRVRWRPFQLRIKGKGIERGEERGDQFCVIRVVMPKNMSDSEKASIKELATKYPIDARADVPWK